jgi:pimeloyl-ACP methyl ester carboxylesterase
VTGGAAARPVVVVHGLWMRPLAMGVLARRLGQAGPAGAGLIPYRFGYPSRHAAIADHAARLDDWLAARFVPGQPLGFLGHSLGGVVLRALAARRPEWFAQGRTVMLGTPNQGAAGAARILSSRLGRWWLGVAGRELAGEGGGVAGLPVPDGAVGVIAGTRPRRITAPFLDGVSDGMVHLRETALPGVERRCFYTSHMRLMFSPVIAEASAHFLLEGRFPADGRAAGTVC